MIGAGFTAKPDLTRYGTGGDGMIAGNHFYTYPSRLAGGNRFDSFRPGEDQSYLGDR